MQGVEPSKKEDEKRKRQTRLKKDNAKDVREFCHFGLAESYRDQHRNLFGHLALLLAIPVTESERGFSSMKKTKMIGGLPFKTTI